MRLQRRALAVLGIWFLVGGWWTTLHFWRSPELANSLKNLDATLTSLKSVSAKLDQRIDPLAQNLDKTLSTVSRNMDAVGASADKLAGFTDQTAAPLASLKQAADDLSKATATFSELASEGGPALHNASQTLKELKEAARAFSPGQGVRLVAKQAQLYPDYQI